MRILLFRIALLACLLIPMSCKKDKAEKPADDEPAASKATDDKPTDDKPTDDKPADDKPADDKPADDKPAPQLSAEASAEEVADFNAICGVIGELLGDGPDTDYFKAQLGKLSLKSDWGKKYADHLVAGGADSLYEKNATTDQFLKFASKVKVSGDCKITVEVMGDFGAPE